MTSGYSGTPLYKKLGIKEELVVGTVRAPDGFVRLLGDLPEGVAIHEEFATSDIIVLFARWRAEIEKAFVSAKTHIAADGAIWVAWPKRSSGVETDLTEDGRRERFLHT